MMWLCQSDARPVVTTLQKLLGGLACDGVFAPNTSRGVREFQGK
jgi:peptidoglycan hydrolase-like protein with peptidoglycan-binding domain